MGTNDNFQRTDGLRTTQRQNNTTENVVTQPRNRSTAYGLPQQNVKRPRERHAYVLGELRAFSEPPPGGELLFLVALIRTRQIGFPETSYDKRPLLWRMKRSITGVHSNLGKTGPS